MTARTMAARLGTLAERISSGAGYKASAAKLADDLERAGADALASQLRRTIAGPQPDRYSKVRQLAATAADLGL